jgi:uncharacterized protein (DUF362 family)
MKNNRKIFLNTILILLIFIGWLSWDISQANKNMTKNGYKTWIPAKELNAITTATTKVSIVRSDDTTLTNPIPLDDETIDYEHIEPMVRKAVELAGGFQWLIKSGDMVLLKPNIVDMEPPGSGEVTDVRVVKALIKIIDEIDPGNIEIVVGEGSPRPMDYELPYAPKWGGFPAWQKLWDAAGYQDLLTDSYLTGINFRFSNLNGSPSENPWQDLIFVTIPGGGVTEPQNGQYYIHKDVLNADVFITIPVAKIHDTGITITLKNQIGIAPSTRYGFSKGSGVPQDNYQTKLFHAAMKPVHWTDEEIVDLSTIADIDFIVVDAIGCLESQKTADWNYDKSKVLNMIRLNSIVAGSDPVAVDHVCSRLMGLNPDDINHITLGERIGLGINDPDMIEIVGADLTKIKCRFKKRINKAYADFGQSNREWILRGPFSISGISDPIDYQFIENEADLLPEPLKNDWSEAIYFFDDRIDLNAYYNNPADVVVYAFSYFDAPFDQTAELWTGSDEALKIYINGEVVYNFKGNRLFDSSQLVSSKKLSIPIKAGENRLLVKVLQTYGYFDFSLNICEPESNPDYDGNRVWNLKFRTDPKSSVYVADRNYDNSLLNLKYELYNCYPNPFNSHTQISFYLSASSCVKLWVSNIKGEKVKTLLNRSVLTSGQHKIQWNGTDDNHLMSVTGVYFITLAYNNDLMVRKVLFIK